MSAPAFEAFLAHLYVDATTRARFLVDPTGEAERAGLSSDECQTLSRFDWVGLELAARSFDRKRQQTLHRAGRRLGLWRRVTRRFRRIMGTAAQEGSP
ncbi:MAG: hypothetical protein HW416_1355 [Chloroflexi bacterium]|nr:hypothetical protein [Chloroflexota bacterium]